MKIIRFQDAQDEVCYGAQQDDGQVSLIEGDIYGDYRDTGQQATVAKLLAPVPRLISFVSD